jgi:hypothetical protein
MGTLRRESAVNVWSLVLQIGEEQDFKIAIVSFLVPASLCSTLFIPRDNMARHRGLSPLTIALVAALVRTPRVISSIFCPCHFVYFSSLSSLLAGRWAVPKRVKTRGKTPREEVTSRICWAEARAQKYLQAREVGGGGDERTWTLGCSRNDAVDSCLGGASARGGAKGASNGVVALFDIEQGVIL